MLFFLLERYISTHNTLVVPLTHTGFGPDTDRGFADTGPRLWNTLLSTLRQITSYGQFMRHLKAHLFKARNHGAL